MVAVVSQVRKLKTSLRAAEVEIEKLDLIIIQVAAQPY